MIKKTFLNPEFLNEVTQKICNALPHGLKVFKDDLEKNVRGALQQAFNKMDLITREEFDAQTKVLLRTAKKLKHWKKKLLHSKNV